MLKQSIVLWGLAAALACNVGYAETAPEPSIPQQPKSEAECDAFGEAFDGYWKPLLEKTRERDERCKRTYTGEIKEVTSYCLNADGKVTYKSPCHDIDQYEPCLARRKQGRLKTCKDRIKSLSKKALDVPAKAKPTDTPPQLLNPRLESDPSQDQITQPNFRKENKECLEDTNTCMNACVNAGESDLLLCRKECVSYDDTNRGYCFGRAK
jgi:hypothetical protein